MNKIVTPKEYKYLTVINKPGTDNSEMSLRIVEAKKAINLFMRHSESK